MTPLALATLFSAFLVVLVVPGQDFVMVVRMSVSRSLRTGVATAAGTATGLLIWGVASMVGVAALLDEYPGLSRALRVAGAAALVAFGLFSIVRAARAKAPTAIDLSRETRPEGANSLIRGWRAGLFSNLSNAKLLVFFTTLFTSLVPHDVTPLEATLILATMTAIAFGWFASIAVIGARPRISAAYARSSRRMDVVFGLFFVGIGVVLLAA